MFLRQTFSIARASSETSMASFFQETTPSGVSRRPSAPWTIRPRLYQIFSKHNRPAIPYTRYDSPLVGAAIEQHNALQSKADRLYNIEMYWVAMVDGNYSKKGLFLSYPKGSRFTGEGPGATAILNSVFRRGHTLEEKTDQRRQLWAMFQYLTGIATEQLAISLQEVPSTNVMVLEPDHASSRTPIAPRLLFRSLNCHSGQCLLFDSR
jgi:hypothetical protein